MSSSTLPGNAGPPSEFLPPPCGPDRLEKAVREAAQKQKLSSRVARRYRDWIFLFVGWCLKATPHRVSETRIGDFWDALSTRGLSQARVCQAMDALSLLFGAVGEPKRHLYPDGPPERSADQPESCAQNDLWRSPDNSADYLPDGTLPPSADPQAVVPTRGRGQAQKPETAQEEAAQEANSGLCHPEEDPIEEASQNPEEPTFSQEERPASTGPPQTFWEAAERIS